MIGLMGILDWLAGTKRTSSLLSFTSPYSSTGTLHPIVATDLLSDEIRSKLPLTREQAISVPAVSKARNLLVSTIAKFPIKAYEGDLLLADQPAFLYRTGSTVTPYERMAWTIDDLMFHGYSVWLVTRGPKEEGAEHGPILQAEYCPIRYVQITNGNILIDEKPVVADEVIFFNSPFEGLLNIANRTITAAIDQEKAWAGRAKNPVPLIDLHQVDDQMTEVEVKAVVDAWAKARTSENGAIGSTPPSIEIRTYGEVKADLMVEGRNAVRTDVGSFVNIRASMLDGTMGIDSLTYSTTEGERNSFYEFDLPFWTDPIVARLSMDDVVDEGQHVRFEMYSDPNTPAPPARED